MNQKDCVGQTGIVGIFVLAAVLAGAALFIPLPYYQKDDVYCESYPPQLCAKKGWHLGRPLWKQALKLQEKTDSSPVLTQQPTPDPTANWKTYINKEKKYSLKYPSEIFLQLICPDEEKTNFYLSKRKGWDEFKTQDSVNMPTCARGGRYDIEITTPHLPPDPKRNQYYQYYSVESKDVSVGGVPAGMYVYNPIKEIPDAEGLLPPWGIDVLLTRDEVNYVFSLSDEKWTSIFEMILDTVKFTSE